MIHETWTLNINTLNKLEAFEMWVFRSLLKVWTSYTTNAEVLEMSKHRKLLTMIKHRTFANLGHIVSHIKYQFLKLIMKGKIEGNHGVDRKKYSRLKNI